MIKERVITVIKESELKNPELEERTGINRYTWQNIRNKPERALKTEEIEAVIKLFPEFAYWIATGETIAEAGQVSPEMEKARSEHNLKIG
tara:strand:+ start:134 stop:403 length:270 start_codon:yes stop_codon:yes gene_type:complete